jgi:hypothetical protein
MLVLTRYRLSDCNPVVRLSADMGKSAISLAACFNIAVKSSMWFSHNDPWP